MNQNKQDLWYVFEQLALSILYSKGDFPSEVGSKIGFLFGMRSFPTFDNPISWKAYTYEPISGEGVKYIAVRDEWDRETDSIKFESEKELTRYKYRGDIVPTFHNRIIEIQLELIKPMLEVISSKSLSFEIPSTLVGCDGVNYELVFGNSCVGITLNWWCEGPQSWHHITSAFFDIFNSFENLCFR